MKLVVMGKAGFKNREVSTLKNTSRLFWTIRLQLQGTERIVISIYTAQKWRPFDCEVGG